MNYFITRNPAYVHLECVVDITKEYTITTTTGNVNTNTIIHRGVGGIFIGVPQDQLCWLIYLPGSHRVAVSNDVTFDENFESALSYTAL
jgi:hypothetical protein